MAVLLEMDPSPEQREELARDLITHLGMVGAALTPYETGIVAEINDGRAVTVGRYHVIREAAARFFGE